MSKDYVRRTTFARVGGFGASRLAATIGQYRGSGPLIGANDSPDAPKWPRPMRFVVALSFGASVWLAILSRIQL
ncbi:hypothetical protein [Porphyrobacter sp. LM 6]|uniref:hypothetical protein n=1 Tax=Porphyrobacter sp. LM 6 TaxID=1896196 RepID=UPI000846AB3D|nr:hypothetical protein [Porphyrobacter sp. LM 6]AOL94442.1 hypothetical protein BG023_111509 [Porphyrobacter sp. LM 6]